MTTNPANRQSSANRQRRSFRADVAAADIAPKGVHHLNPLRCSNAAANSKRSDNVEKWIGILGLRHPPNLLKATVTHSD